MSVRLLAGGPFGARVWRRATQGVGTDHVLIPGASGRAWYWHLVAPSLTGRGHRAIAVELPRCLWAHHASGWLAAVTGIMANIKKAALHR